MRNRSAPPIHAAHRQRGFSLLEAVIVLGLIAGLLAVGSAWLYYQGQTTQKNSRADTVAREIAMIAAAADKSIAIDRLPGASPTDTSRHGAMAALAEGTLLDAGPALSPAMTVSDLITQGFLPADFAKRVRSTGGTAQVGVSPYGQTYNIMVRKGPSDGTPTATYIVQAVVYEDLAPSSAALERSGIQNTADQLFAMKLGIATNLMKDFKAVSAVFKQGDQRAYSPSNSFNINMDDWFPTASANTVAAALVRFDYLDATRNCASNPTMPHCPPVGPGSGIASGTNCVLLPPSETSICSGDAVPPFNFGGGGSNTYGATLLNSARPRTTQTNGVNGTVDNGNPIFRDTTLLASQFCSGTRTPTCPYGKSLKQSIPAKCVNALGPTANAVIPTYKFMICDQTTLANGTLACTNYYAHWGELNMQGMIPNNLFPPPTNTSIGFGNPMLSNVSIGAYPHLAQVPQSTMMFSEISQTPEFIGTPVGPGSSGWTTTAVQTGAGAEAVFNSTITMANTTSNYNCAKWEGSYNNYSPIKDTKIGFAYQDTMTWSLCCDD